MNIYTMSTNQIPSFVTSLLQTTLAAKPNSVLGVATGSTPIMLYKEWIRLNRLGRLSFANTITFNLDEYISLPREHSQSYWSYMKNELFKHLDVLPREIHIPRGDAPDMQEECLRYDRQLKEAGGIDWQLLGIGHNGHIGFNEPNQALEPHTHIVQLSDKTRAANARFFHYAKEVPTQAITMGMADILLARSIVLVATGEEKSKVISAALCGPITTKVPASLLQMHSHVTVVLDIEAARYLPEHKYTLMKIDKTPSSIIG